MKTLSTILISALVLSSSALASIPKTTETKSLNQIKQYALFQDNYESLWQVPDEEIPRRKIRLTEKDYLPTIDPKITTPLPIIK